MTLPPQARPLTQQPLFKRTIIQAVMSRLSRSIINSNVCSAWLVLSTVFSLPSYAQNATPELRLLTHSAFDLPKPLLDQFESDNHVKLVILKSGDAGEMLNKLILTRAQPIADLVYGIDNILQHKAIAANVLAALPDAALDPLQRAAFRPNKLRLDSTLIATDYGYVALNYDIAALAKRGLTPPKNVWDLTLPAYKNMVVVQNPATSSTGNAFLLATIAGLGEDKAFEWWKQLRQNGLKTTQGWTEAYNIEFSRNGGKYPIVVSYALSPAAEMFYSPSKSAQAPTAVLDLPGAVFKQIEGIAIVKNSRNPNPKTLDLALKFIRFMQSKSVQTALQTSMWMQAIDTHVKLDNALLLAGKHNLTLQHALEIPSATIAAKQTAWVSRWTKTVLK